VIDSTEPYPHQPDAGRAPAGASAPATGRHPVVPMPTVLLRGAVRELRALDLERRAVLAIEAWAAPADRPVLLPGDRRAEPDREHGMLAQLRAATTMQVRALHAAGEPPERALAQVKRTLHAALAQEGWRDPVAIEPLVRRVVRWSIDAYYDA
jgi:hypothetical protein